MALYPSLEDMKLDHMEKAQMSMISLQQAELARYTPHEPTAPSAPLYPNLGMSPPPAYTMPPNLLSSDLGVLYPSLNEYMGLELTPAVIAANMPEYSQILARQNANNEVQVAKETRDHGGIVAPLSNQTLGLQRAQVSHGVREVSLCKDASGKVGLRVAAVNSGVFVCLVSKGAPASRCGIRFGDQILQINGENVAGYTMDKVHDLFRKSGVNGIKVILRDRPFERTVTLHKDSVGHVGFHFKNGQITGLVKDSSAARNGLLTEHQLLEIDGQNVIGMKDKQISQIIDGSDKVVTVTIIPVYIYEHMMKKMAVNLVKSSMDHSTPNV